MFNSSRSLLKISNNSSRIISAVLLMTTLLVSAVPAWAAQDDQKKRAFELYKDGKFAEAMPLFEKLAAENPNDRAVLEAAGILLIGQAVYLKDEASRKETRRKGRELLARAQELGADGVLLKTMLASVQPDGGGAAAFSSKKEIDDAMRDGEAAFAKGDYPKAVENYQRALLLDPKLYEAALFTGDVYYKSAEQRRAGEWFARAIEIDPDRETAYRYWGDSLLKQGKITEAGDKFVEAYIAEPYSRLAQAGLVNWGQRVNVALGHPKVDIPTSVSKKDNGNSTITLDPKTLSDDNGGSGAAWMTYGLIRAGWTNEFAKQYPDEKTYRHSLKEEVAALRAAIKVQGEQKNLDPKKADPSLILVAKLDKEGLLESFVLLALPDAGIAQDFSTYRKTNKDSLRRYVNQYVMTGGGKN